jgi:DNA-binding transcriptional regulator YhcF (GntR family)
MTQVQEWKDTLQSISRVDLREHPKDARLIRKAISQLRKEGIIFVPVGHYTYADVAKHTTLQDKAREFAQAQKKALITQYRNTLKPLNQFLTEADKRELMGELL